MLTNASILRKVATTAIRRSMATEGTLLNKDTHLFVYCLFILLYCVLLRRMGWGGGGGMTTCLSSSQL